MSRSSLPPVITRTPRRGSVPTPDSQDHSEDHGLGTPVITQDTDSIAVNMSVSCMSQDLGAKPKRVTFQDSELASGDSMHRPPKMRVTPSNRITQSRSKSLQEHPMNPVMYPVSLLTQVLVV